MSDTANAADRIPLVDLKAQYQEIQSDVKKGIDEVLESQRFVLGPVVEGFEREFARYLGVKHCLCVQSGTSALWLALWACGIKPGDEVVTTPCTFFATVEAILLCGAKPVFADIDPKTHNLDPKKAEAAVTPRTKAILPVHLFGQAADMDAFQGIAKRKGLSLIEDAAQAAGSTYRGRKAGSFSRMAAFSFYPGKNLGAYGDAGAVATDDDGLAQTVRRLRDHGSLKKNYHDVLGANFRLEAIQGAVLSAKLKRLDKWNAARRRHAEAYRRELAGAKGLSIVEERPEGRSNYHLFVVRHARRDELLQSLHERGIEADIHYPVGCHLQPALGSARLAEGSLPLAEKAVREIVSLPMFPELTDEQRGRITAAVLEFCGRS